MSGQLLIAAQGWIFSWSPCCMGGRRWKLCHHQNCLHCSSSGAFCAHGRATERRGGNEHQRNSTSVQQKMGNTGVRVCPSEALEVSLIVPTTHTTSPNRLIHSPDAETLWSNYAEHYVLKWAVYIGKCRLKILWIQHSSKYRPVIYCVHHVPFYDIEFLYLIFFFCLDFPRVPTKLMCPSWENTCW